MTECIICQRAVQWPQLCEGCRQRIRADLHDLVAEYALLDATPGASAGQRVSGTRTAPLPVRLDVLNLVGPGADGVHDPHGDQVGDLPPLAWLDGWVRDWRDVRGQGEHLPAATMTELTAWIEKRLDWAGDSHPAVDEFAAELRKQVGALRAVNGTGAGKPERMILPCPTCDQRALVRDGGDIHCRGCGRILRQAEYDQRAAIAAGAYQEATG